MAQGVTLLKMDLKTSLFALYKPEGVKSHPNKKGIDKKSLLLAPYDLENEFYLEGDHKIHLLNRLDSPTSGVVLLCLDDHLAPVIRKLFKERKVHKTYNAIVKGRPPGQPANWQDRLLQRNIGQKVRTEKGGATIAKTAFKCLKYNAHLGISLIELNPITGFTHQLRVQCALRKCPILGDKTYGDFAFNKKIEKSIGCKGLCLHALKIEFDYEFEDKIYHFKVEAPIPEWVNLFI